MVANNNIINYTKKQAWAGTTEHMTKLSFVRGSPPAGLLGRGCKSNEICELNKDRAPTAGSPGFSGKNRKS